MTLTDTPSFPVIDPWTSPYTGLPLRSPQVDKLDAAMVQASLEFQDVVKDKMNPAFKSKYADLGATLEATKPYLLKHGVLPRQATVLTASGQTVLRTEMHHAGQFWASEYLLKPTRDDPQGMGSAMTYARRYTVQGELTLAPEDDDGNAASRPRDNGRSEAPPPERPREPSGRDWAKEAEQITDLQALIALGHECAAFGEMTGETQAKLFARRAQLEKAVAEQAAAQTTSAKTAEGNRARGAQKS